jgi:hypothetical protein
MSSRGVRFSGSSAAADLEQVVDGVRRTGVGVLRGAFQLDELAEARRTVEAHTGLMKNTRPTASALHLAGFHRFPALEPLHQLITGNRATRAIMTRLLGADHQTIGLSDITINRSQQWHKDLLRGRFSHHLGDEHTCERDHGKVFKVIAYLQDSSSLHVVPGSHRQDISLESDLYAIPESDENVTRVETRLGDAVIIDICTTHRGSPEEVFQSAPADAPLRILVSTVFGGVDCDFTRRMEVGNAERLSAWARRHT